MKHLSREKLFMLCCLLAVVSVFFLQGCATQLEPVPVYTPVDVTKVVAVPCIEQKDLPVLPVFATQLIQGHETDCELVNIVLTERAQQKKYIEELQGVLAGCVKPAGS